MRTLFFTSVAALALAACGRGSPASGPACPHDPDLGRAAPFEVVVGSVPTVIRHDTDLAGLARVPGTEALGPGGKLQGLTVVEHRLAYRTGIAVTSRLLPGPVCSWIDKLTVDMTPQSLTILVPRDYAEGSCEYEQILAHERLHEEVHRDTLAEYADRMRRALAATAWLPARGTPLAVADRPEAERRVEEMVDKATKPVYAEFQAELKRRQSELDVPENYLWVARRCGHWK